MTIKVKTGRGRKGERELIEAIRVRASQPETGKSRMLVLGIGDDCAVLRPSQDEELVITTDLSLENVHFRRDWHPPESVGHRCLARGLSDLAAMGARPAAAFLSLALPRELTGRWLERFLNGWMLLGQKYHLPLAGGDLAESPRSQNKRGGGLVAADIVAIGSVPRGKALLRSGARDGDILYVTGRLGGAAIEFRALKRQPAAYRKRSPASEACWGGHPHLYPEPRINPGRRLMQARLATAAIDLSDGLSTDLVHLCETSGVGALLSAAAVPLAPGATLEDALYGGEDYELLFTARPAVAMPAKVGGVPVHAIGKMTRRNRPIELLTADGKRTALSSRGWEHFRSRRERLSSQLAVDKLREE